MGKEIERKFLVDHQKWSAIDKPMGNHFQQGYLLINPEKTIRVRVTDQSGFITIKGKSTGATRLEYEYAIPIAEAQELLQNFAENIIEKVRYKIVYKGKLWEIDEFQDKNEGLIMAEIELKQETEAFDLPQWILKEVTGDIRYYNSYLSEHPFSQWN